MVGRRRRAPSNSTVATIDEATIQFYKEDSVLKPASTRIHTDDWPCFLLADATVYHQDGTLANLLHVDLEGPFITRGRLEVEKDQEKYLVNRHMRDRSPWIQIQNTLSFSIGLKVDEPRMPVLWASGGAGWFEIVPSDAYRDMCDIMFQGICLHFAVLDRYEVALEKLHKKKKNAHKTLADAKVPLDTLLFDVSTVPKALSSLTMLNSSHIVCEKSSSLEAPESKKKGRPSLRSSASRTMRANEMISADVTDLSSDEPSREGRTSRTRRRSPFNLPSRTAQGADVTMLDVPADKHHSSNRPLGLEQTRSLNHMSIGSEKPQLESQDTISNTRIHSDLGSPMSIVLEALQDARHDVLELLREGKQKKHPDDMNPKTWCNKLYLELSIRNPKALSEICEYFAADLVPLLGPEWHTSQFYKWLKENVNTTPKFEYITEADMATITRRKKKHKTREDTRDTTEDNELLPQPAANRVAVKQPSRGRRSGKVAGLRPFTGSKKRMRHEAAFGGDEMDIDEDGVPQQASKRSRQLAEDDDEDARDTVSSVSDDEEDEDKDVPLTRVVIRAEKLPSPTPKGLDQTWTCEEPDCDYVVRAADEEEGQALISEHYEEHEKEAAEEAEADAKNRTSLLGLAMQEAERRHLPVNHLLDKIRKLGDKTQRREEVRLNGQVLPQPIKRNLLV
ncbi:hypothetical protein Hte_006107 [Hypoxylon texense]